MRGEVYRMKSMNAKRIVAVAAGAAMIGAAFAGAVSVDESGLGNYKFFSNDTPDVKIVVGSAAQASDAVAAANIAAMIGNLAYASRDITVVGKDQVSCPAGEGQCTVDEASKSVTLDVTTPTGPAGAYQMKTYIEDNLDSNPDVTRNITTSYDGSLQKSGTVIMPGSGQFPKSISGSDTTVLKKDYVVTGVRALTIKETEWVYGFSFTTFDDPTDSVMAKTVRAAYKAVFANPLPFCLDTTKNGNTTASACADSDLTKNNHVQVYFLGDKWTVVDMGINALTGVVTSITLGKETAYSPVMQIGDELVAANGAKVKLKSISGIGYTTAYLPYASFEITDPVTGTVSTKTIQTGGEEQVAGVVVHVNKIFPGVNQVNYADVSIYSDKLDLFDGQQISGHGNWRAIIASSTYGNAPAAAEIGVYNPVVTVGDFKAGESFTLITNQPALKLTYVGLEEPTYDPLVFTSPGSSTSTMPTTATGNYTAPAYFLTISSGKTDAFKNVNPTINTNLVKVALTANTSAGAAGSVEVNAGSVWALDETGGYWVNIANGTVDYYYSSSDWATITFLNATEAGGNAVQNGTFVIQVPEFLVDNQVGQVTPTTTNAGYLQFYWNPTTYNFVNSNATGAASDQAYYNNLAGLSNTTAKPVYYSPRGGKLTGFGSSSVQYQYATSLVHAKYLLEGAANVTAGAARTVAKVGDTVLDESGYKVTVVGIDCTASGAGACGAPTGLDALAPSEPSAMVVKALDTSESPLVITDAQAGGVAKAIVVGGPVVNTVAREALGEGAITSATEAMVKVVDTKVIVAGYTAADTQAAANSLIRWLADNRDRIVR